MTRAATLVVRPPPNLGSRLCRSNVQVDPKANGATAFRKGCRGPAEPGPVVPRRGVVQCLSCMRRNGARAVLRGEGEGDLTSLPDPTVAARGVLRPLDATVTLERQPSALERRLQRNGWLRPLEGGGRRRPNTGLDRPGTAA